MNGTLTLPTRIPNHPIVIEDPPPEPGGSGSRIGVVGSTGPMGANTTTDRFLSTLVTLTPVTRPVDRTTEAAVAPPPAPIIRVRQGGVVKEAVVIRRVEPVYPEIAKRARIGGKVELEGVIGTDGRIRELKVLSGHPFLTAAALEAVRQWLYRPTLLNGDAVEVIAPITVTFRLN
jgi:protein TonB